MNRKVTEKSGKNISTNIFYKYSLQIYLGSI